MNAKEIFESRQWDMIEGVRYLDEEECLSLIDELRKVENNTLLVSLKGFADDIIQAIWDGYSELDGGEIQEFAVKHGIIEKYYAKEPCCEDCTCKEFGSLPCECYRRTY